MKLSTLLAASLFAAAAVFAAPVVATTPPAPSLKVTTLDGQPFDLAAQRGKWVIVNYWATWCVPCIKEMPDISRFVAAHKNVTAIGLAYEDSEPAEIKAFLAKRPVVYPIAQVPLDQPVPGFEEPANLPTTWLIDPQGRVADHIVGPIDDAWLAARIK